MTVNVKKNILEEIGYLSDIIPSDVYGNLLTASDIDNNSTKLKYTERLAGQIEEEYYVKDNLPLSFKQYIKLLSSEYFNLFPLERMGREMKVEITEAWLNVQKKYEYNPIHSHHGDLSFVIWIKIPYKLEDEFAMSNSKSSRRCWNSLFAFFTENKGMTPLYVNSQYEGKIILFKSSLLHQVFPFYSSDESRVSLAGNIKIDWLT